jgi:diguanylate cyclase (GGDEF)-like protein
MNSKPVDSTMTNMNCPVDNTPCQFLQELKTLRAEVDVLNQQVRTDALTSLYNFRFFSDTLPLEMERSRRSALPLSLIILDLDHFKQFNDRWGHEMGNQALMHIARLILVAVRKVDFACRFGGEEFAIILPNTELSRAMIVAQRLRELIAGTPFLIDKERVLMTASLGLDEYSNTQGTSAKEFIQRVDAWLYEAKKSGRNCVKAPEVVGHKGGSIVTTEEKDTLFGTDPSS